MTPLALLAALLGVVRRHARVVGEVALVVAFLACLHVARVAGERAGRAQSTVAALTREKRALEMAREVARVQYVTVRDTVLVRATRYDTLRQTVDVHDTVQVVRVLAAADSTVHACRLLVTSCEARGRIDSLTIANRDSLVTATRALIPTRWDRVRGAAKWAAIGAAALAIYSGAKR